MTDNAEWNAAIDAALTKVREQRAVFSSDEYATPQPIGGFQERFACNSIEAAIEALRRPETPATVQSVRERMLSDAVVDKVTRQMFGNCLPVNRLVARAAITAALDAAGVA